MARPMIVTFPMANSQGLLTTTVAGGPATSSIVLNASYPIVFPGISRPITLTSTNNLGAVNFTITGLDRFGTPISEVLAGPNANTVTSVNYYNTILNVASSGVYTNFSIGTGSTGFLQWIPLNYQIDPFSISIQAIVFGTINYSLFQTLDRIAYYKPIETWYQYIIGVPSPYLANNPLATVNGSAVVTVTVPSTAGLVTGNVVAIAGATATGGITAPNLNISAPITVTSATTFTYNAAAGATGTVVAGGGAIVTYTYPLGPNSFPIVAALTGATTNQIYSTTNPALAIGGIINASSAGGSLILTILQVGV
jgi:hypothetical protein